MFTKINPFRMSRMDMGSCCNFHFNVIKVIEEYGPEQLQLQTLFPDYRRQADTLQSILNRQRAKVNTVRFAEADKQRDHGVGYIMLSIRAAKTSLLPAKRQAAIRLIPQLRQFRGLARHLRAQANSEVESMLAVLSRPGNAQAVAALRLEDDIEALRQANQHMDRVLDDLASETVTFMGLRSLHTPHVMREINNQYRDIVRVINVLALVSPSPALHQLVGRIVGICGNAAQSIAHSRSNQKPRHEA